MPYTPTVPHQPLQNQQNLAEYNPFDKVEFSRGLGIAILWVVLAYGFVNLLLLPVHVV